MMVCMTVEQGRALAALTPMWTRIAQGQVDLSQYTDEQILKAELPMADGRTAPRPPMLPDVFIDEQRRRGLIKAERKVRNGAMKALDLLADVVEDDTAPIAERIKAARAFVDKYVPTVQHVDITHHGDDDPRERLINRLLAARGATVEPTTDDSDVVEAELMDDLTLEDLL